ncbi:TonB-dependent receptor SusC [Kordia sp. SMS9]|uniref:TonB-dependent receptor n=1 Tax=Kordia sp. SMS9 TaxID=2282170 RepID=UPI000E0DA40C|nr:TonB-dependent receptor [Kordia sp. SMS9]AXG68510.1 TonB-dependent receptor SusC [Kordia sp. SMS9]
MRAYLSILAMLVCAGLFAQTNVSGKVVDGNNMPIPGVNIVVVGASTGTSTDFDGKFKLKVDQEPPFKITASSIGFQDATVEITKNNEDVTIVLNEGSELDEIVISASRTPERIRESPVTIERMDARAIRNSSAPTYYDALENLKGVDINTNSLTFKSVNTRGFATFANTRFMQLVDGMDNSSPALNFALGNLLGMSELDVDTVELLPGASSALYGANAFNGIMFMRSKDPYEHQGITFYAKSGMTSSSNAGDNIFVDFGFRAAHAFSDKLAVKASFSFLNGTEWFATDYTNYDAATGDALTGDRSNPGYNGLNIYGDEVDTTLDFDAIAGTPTGTFGSERISRTGYEERDLMDYDAESVKADLALHYKPWANDFTVIWNSKIGRGNTIYQGANRYSIKNFFMQQHKLEIRNNNFFIRGYVTAEKAGDSYDTRFTAINVNRRWKSDQQWFTEYATGYLGAITGGVPGVTPGDPTIAHAFARGVADTGRLVPGTPGFKNALNSVTADGDLLTGSRFIDNTKLYHADVNYNFSHLIDVADIQVGGSFREYVLDSQGTIFTDVDGPIRYDEYGAYLQVQKKFMEDKMKFTGSIRYDKAQNFDGNFSPRLSLVFSPDEAKKHNFRASFQTGFRNPTTQDQYIGLDVGNAILVGSAPDNLDRYTTRPITNNFPAALEAFGLDRTVTLSGNDAYNNSFTLASFQRFGATGDVSVLERANVEFVKPEQVSAFEVGYRGIVYDNIAVDVSAYYNAYKDFIANRTVIVPNYGNVNLSDQIDLTPVGGEETPLAVIAAANGDFTPFQLYSNSNADINSYGVAIGVNTKVFGDFDFGINYTYAKLDFDQASDPDFETNFNTPEHKVKASFGNNDLFDNFGFNINYRWNDAFLWESTFADGMVTARSLIDLQVNYRFKKSTIKLGAANILGHEYLSAPGVGTIGAQYFVSWVIN